MTEREDEALVERQQTDAVVQLGTKPVPRIIRRLATKFEWRHVRGIAVIRVFVALWLVFLGFVLCAYGYWWGATLFVAAGMVASLAYLMPRWKLTIDAEMNIQRVRELERSRARVVDDSAARLRRIEQDLHDGAQAQMVAVVMKLGLATEHLGNVAIGDIRGNLERVRELVNAARFGAMEAITELRDLARGIYPPALDEGLGAALAAIVTLSNVPVELIIDIPERPSAAIETIAYFCAAELLTNVAKHSSAQRVTLEAMHQPGLVRVRVSDDGAGGAGIQAGGGLAGLAQRVKTVDGKLVVISPTGGPTVVTVELPSRA
jgi:signal transduction histidine kinase